MKHSTLLMTVLLSLMGARQSFSAPLSEDFESISLVDADGNSLPNAWSYGYGLSNGWKVVGGSIYASAGSADYGLWTQGHESNRALEASYSASNNAFIVIPEKFTGRVSFWARKTSSSSSTKGTINVFEVVEENGTYTKVGTLYTNSSLTTTWTQYTVDLGEGGTLIAINMVRAGLDDFEAERFEDSGVVVEKRSLSLTEAVSTMEGTQLTADENNQISLSFDVTLRNTGNVDLTPGMEDYSLTILNVSDGLSEELATVPITETLAVGETKTIGLQSQVTVPASLAGTFRRFAVRENLKGTSQTVSGNFSVTAYLPKFAVYDEEPSAYTSALSSGAHVFDFGNVAQATSRTCYIRNAGSAPLHVTSITAPEGFTVTPTSLTVAAYENKTVTITLQPVEGSYGSKSGDVVVTAGGFEPFILGVKGVTRDPAVFFVDFNDRKIPENWTAGSLWHTDYATYGSTDYFATSYQYGATEASPLVTPKLTVAEGEKMTFTASCYSESATTILKVAYSNDQKTWTTLTNLSNELTTDFASFELTDIPAGNWYIRFLGVNVQLDNIFGFRLCTEAPQLSVYASQPNEGEAEALASGTSIAFGSVAETASRTFFVKNTGTGTLSVTSITVPEGFAVAPSSLELAAGESAAVTLTLQVDADSYGTKSGTVTFEATDLKPFTLSVSGTTRDPAQLYVTFDDGQLPQGWATGEWEVGSDIASTPYAKVSGESVLITPMLEVREDESLTFEAKAWDFWYQSQAAIAVSYSADRETWTEATTEGPSLSNVFAAYSVSDIPAGRWYVRFVGVYAALDNVSGFRVSRAEHDLFIASVDMPAEATVNHLYEATVLVQNLGLAAETVTATLTIDEQVVAKSEPVELASGDSHTFAFSFTPHEPVQDAQALVCLATTGDYAVQTAPQPLTIAAESDDTNARRLSGTVTDGDQPLVASVVLRSGDVLYVTTTAEDGTFSLKVWQGELDYELTVSAEGRVAVVESVSFADGDLTGQTYILRDATGFYVEQADMSATAMRNVTYVATASLYAGSDLVEGGYTATLHFGEQSVEARAVAVEAGTTALYSFSLTALTVGEQEAFIEFVIGDRVLKTAPVTVAVAEETATLAEAVVGQADDVTEHAPVNTYYSKGRAEMLYPQTLIGESIVEGSAIEALSFNGYIQRNQPYTTHVKVWAVNTDNTSLAETFAPADISAMTLVFEGDVEVSGRGSESEHVQLFRFDFTEPLVYEGRSLRLVVEQVSASDADWAHVYVDAMTDAKALVAYCETDGDLSEATWKQEATGLPVAHFHVNNSTHLAGTVVSSEDGSPIAGATVTLAAGEVTYATTTDAEGRYELVVIQTDKLYQLTVEAPDYVTATEENVAVSADITGKTVSLAPVVPVGISPATCVDRTLPAYDLTGRCVNPAVARPRGIYVQGGRKYILR